jgi:glycosyltransferase involved in cell wall biosynthesis
MRQMKRINVTVLVSSLTIGGTEQLLRELLRNIHGERFRVHVCFLRSPGLMGAEILRLNFPVTTNVLKHRFDFSGILKLARLFKAERTDVLFLINQHNTIFYGVLAAKLAGVRAIVNRENEMFMRYSFHGLTVLGRRILYQWIDKVVAIADGHRDYIASVEKVPLSKIEIIYNGVDPLRFCSSLSSEEAKARLGIPANSPVVSIIAALRPDKAHEVFLMAAQTVLKSVPETHFLIVGDGPERNRLTRLAHDLGIDGSVHFLGFRRDLGDILAAVDVNTLSSRPEQETLSVAAIEAMSAGVPIVCTDVGCMKEIVLPGKTGYLVQVGDFHGLAGRLIELIQNPAACRSMGKTAQGLVHEKLTVQKMTAGFEDLFAELYERK